MNSENGKSCRSKEDDVFFKQYKKRMGNADKELLVVEAQVKEATDEYVTAMNEYAALTNTVRKTEKVSDWLILSTNEITRLQ